MELKSKTILIVAQEDWGDMYISKHHYACELARAGNFVFFINGPDQVNKLKPGEVKIMPSNITNLLLVEHRFFYPLFIKFKANWLHRLLVQVHINNIIKRVARKIDIIWSFDLSNTIPLNCFPKKITKIYMPVDEPLHDVAIESAQGADVLFSVTNEILGKYSAYSVPKYFINHGVSDKFIAAKIVETSSNPVRIGLSGNMLRPDIDHDILIEIILSNPKVRFDIWGINTVLNSNLISERDAKVSALEFIKTLKSQANVALHGPLKTEQLANAIFEVDGFLICYNIKKDQSRGTNYHKILEYLGTGKVVISNNVTTYAKYPGLIEMISSREDNSDLPRLFTHVINNLSIYNSYAKQYERINFAKKFTYQNQIKKIENALYGELSGTNLQLSSI